MTGKLEVGVCDSNPGYAKALISFINDEEELGMNALLIGSIDELEGLSEKPDVIITDDQTSLVISEHGCYMLGNIPCLVIGDEEDGRYVTNRFQDARIICRKAASLAVPEKNFTENKAVGISGVTAVYSPFGRSGKTELAKKLARDGGPSVLYIGMEDISIKPLPADILYLVKSESPKLREQLLNSVSFEDGVNMIRLSEIYLDLRMLTVEDLTFFTEAALSLGLYSSLVFDIGSAALADMNLLSLFDVIYMPVPDGEEYRLKTENFRRILTAIGLGDIFEKVRITGGCGRSGEDGYH